MVSINAQRRQIAKIKRVLTKIADCQRTGAPLELNTEEIDTIERALFCHKSVIEIDLHRRENK